MTFSETRLIALKNNKFEQEDDNRMILKLHRNLVAKFVRLEKVKSVNDFFRVCVFRLILQPVIYDHTQIKI